MADGQTFTDQFGGKPKPISASGVIGGRYPPLAGYMWHGVMAFRRRKISVADHPVGNSVGAIGWWCVPCVGFGPGVQAAAMR